jgi:hypothetical protein
MYTGSILLQERTFIQSTETAAQEKSPFEDIVKDMKVSPNKKIVVVT